MVAGLSTIEAWVLPIKSLDTNSFEIEYSICSTKSPNKDACFKVSLMAAKLTSFLKFKFKMAKETSGVGTLTAFPVKIPVK
jgi:hypothetical protein